MARHPVAAAASMVLSTPLTPLFLRHGIRSYSSSTPEGTRLLQWVEKGGAKLWPGLRVEKDGDGFGLLSSQRVEAGQKLITLPSQLVLSVPDSASQNASDRALLRLADRVPEELWTVKLGLKLLAERAQLNSFWWPYLSALPQRFNVPIFFSGEDISNMQYPPLIHQVNKRCRFLLKFVSEDIPSMVGKLDESSHPFGGQAVDAGSLGWAMAAVSSRAFRIRTTRQSEVWSGSPKLLPLIDMCNHSFRPNARLVQDGAEDKGDFTLHVVAEEDIEEGAPILLDYGPLSNDLLLLDYGFVLSENPYDVIELKFDAVLPMLDEARTAAGVRQPKLASFSSPAPWQQAMFVQLGLLGSGAALMTTLRRSQPDCRLLAALRVLFTDDAASLRNKSLHALQEWGSDAPLGLVNESNVLQTVVAFCAMLLSRFPTTVTEDLELLRTPELSASRKLAISFRLNKKQLLLDLINNCWTRLAVFEREHRAARPTKSVRGKGFG